MKDSSSDLISAIHAENSSISTELLARLDVENLHVGDYVDTEVPANVSLVGGGFGNAVCGELKILGDVEQGVLPSVTVGHKGYIYTADFFHAACGIDEHNAKHAFEYIARQAGQDGGGAIIDSSSAPKLKVDYQSQTLELPNGTILHQGDIVTIDPFSGGLWRDSQPIQSNPRLNRLASGLSNRVRPYEGISRLSGHLGGQLSMYDIQMFNNPPIDAFSSNCNSTLDAGLIRTEEFTRNKLKEDLGENGVLDHGFQFSHRIAPSLAFLQAKQRVFRFVDLNALRDLMSPEMQRDLDNGDDHRPETVLFQFRQRLYEAQILKIKNNIQSFEKGHYVFLLPAVKNAEEVKALKEVLMEGLEGAEFGVLMETESALENSYEIAHLCDRLSYGTNDLTQELTGYLRSKWVDAKNEKGKNPYMELTSDVLKAMEDSIQDARIANPDIIISVCGHQVAGHDIRSIEECLRIGVDQIVVPAFENNIMRAAAAISRYDARVLLKQELDIQMSGQEREFVP